MRLIVKNFGPIKNIDIKIKPFTIFIGKQATGKSIIAKLLAIFNDIDFQEGKENFNYFLKSYNIDDFLEEGKTKIEYYYEDTHIRYENNKIENNNKMRKRFQKINLERIKLIKSFLKKNNNMEDSKKLSKKLLELMDKDINFFKTLQNSNLINHLVYYPAERILISIFADSIFSLIRNKTLIPDCIINFGRVFEKARNEIKNYQIPFLEDTKIFTENNKNLIEISENKNIPLTKTSSGMQSSIPLALITEYYSQEKNVLFICEEPEINLYPFTQKKLSYFLSEKCLKNNNHLIITTHSPYILTSFSNLIEAGNCYNSDEETKEKLRKIIPEKYWLDFENVSAYYISDGIAKDILDYEDKNIDTNAIDDVSEEINIEFDNILDLKYEDK